MERLEDLAHNWDYEEEMRRLMNQGYTLEEAEELYSDHLQEIRELQDEYYDNAMQIMHDEGY